MELNRKNVRIILGIVFSSILLFWVLKNLHLAGYLFSTLYRFLSPFIMGGAIAFILNIPMKAIERALFPHAKKSWAQRMRRPLAIFLTLLAVIGVLALVMLIVVPEIGETAKMLADQVPSFIREVQAYAIQTFGENTTVSELLTTLSVDWIALARSLSTWLQDGAGNVLSGTVTAASSIATGIVNFLVGFVFAIYVLAQREKLSRQTKMLLYAWLPEKWADTLCRVGALSCKTFSNFLSGQCLEACILGFLFVVAMTIFRMPYAVLIGVLIAFTALIPIFGAFIGCALGTFLILVQNPMQAVWFLVLFIVLQQLEGNLIYPKVVGNSVGLPSIWVLAAVTFGGSTMGVMGMLVMIPLCSVAYTLLREQVYLRLKKRGIPAEKLRQRKYAVPEPPKEEHRPGVNPIFPFKPKEGEANDANGRGEKPGKNS